MGWSRDGEKLWFFRDGEKSDHQHLYKTTAKGPEDIIIVIVRIEMTLANYDKTTGSWIVDY